MCIYIYIHTHNYTYTLHMTYVSNNIQHIVSLTHSFEIVQHVGGLPRNWSSSSMFWMYQVDTIYYRHLLFSLQYRYRCMYM